VLVLAPDDEGAKLMRFEDVRGPRNTYDRPAFRRCESGIVPGSGV
jgi:hypothetical protein